MEDASERPAKEPKDVTESSVYLHIGFAKTGTTALQKFFHENAGRLAEQGVYYLDNHRAPERGFRDWGHHILSHKWGGWLNPEIFPVTPDEAWKTAAAQIHAQSGRYIISSERFQDLFIQPNYKEILQYIKDTVAPAQLKIIGYVRRQDDFAESHFKELVKNGFSKVDIAQYIENIPEFFDYSAYFSRCAEVVGEENIIVRIFDRKFFFRSDLFEDFAHAIGFTLPEDADLDGKLTNPSLNSALASLVWDPKVRRLWRERTFRSEMFSFFDNRPDLIGKNDPLIGSQQKNRILDDFAESNKALVEKYLGPEFEGAFARRDEAEQNAFNENRLIYSTADVRRILQIASKTAGQAD